ncbi:MAG TPA: hypothetical protein VJA17_02190, partial [Candidatus Omnitrophota bacterium]|nr:hypothetical protein [Candidatus Omnitrophota bacterium]
MSIFYQEAGWEESRNLEKNVLKALRLSFILLSLAAAVYTLYQIFFIKTVDAVYETPIKQNLKIEDPVLIPRFKPAKS